MEARKELIQNRYRADCLCIRPTCAVHIDRRALKWDGQPNLSLPTWTEWVLALLAIPCLIAGCWASLASRRWISSRLSVVSILACIVGGLVAVLFNMKTTSIGDARVAFVGLSAIALVLSIGAIAIFKRIGPRWEPFGPFLWPIVFIAVSCYVLADFLIPLGGL
jgi:hypothetical protein